MSLMWLGKAMRKWLVALFLLALSILHFSAGFPPMLLQIVCSLRNPFVLIHKFVILFEAVRATCRYVGIVTPYVPT